MIKRIQRQKIKNFLRTAALALGMLILLLTLGYLLLGWEGLIWAGLLGAAALALTSQLPAKYVMQMYRGRELSRQEAPHLYRIMSILAQRAGLKEAPKIYYIPHRMLNAFATGRKKDPAIGVTHGLLSHLNLRELTGVMAHEISHIRNNDFRLKGMLNIVGRMTRMFSLVGQFLLIINLPLFLMGEQTIPWLAVLLLILAPSLSGLMMMAISRTRELDADLDAARLTGDPMGLAQALQKLSHLNNGSLLERMMPKKLSSHPETEERVKRLRKLAPRFSPKIEYPESQWVQTPVQPSRQFWA